MTIIKKYNDGTSQWEAIAVGQKGDKGDPGNDGEGVPVGGTTGQSLVKASNTDYDVAWSSDFATSAQGALADTALQPNDDVSELTNDAGYITSAGAPVQSVNTQTGTVTLTASDVGAYPDTNPSSYITSAQAPVQSVNGDTGVVVLDKTDVGLGNVPNLDTTDAVNKAHDQNTDTALDSGGANEVTAADARAHIDSTANPHGVTKTQVGLGNVDNVSAADLRDRSTHTGTQTLSTISDAGTIASQNANNVNIDGGAIDGTAIGAGTASTGEFTALTINNEIVENVFALSGTTPALDPANGTIQTWTLTGNSTPTSSLVSGESILLLIDDGTAYTITWPTMEWIGGSAPTLATSNYTFIELFNVGGTLYGVLVGYN